MITRKLAYASIASLLARSLAALALAFAVCTVLASGANADTPSPTVPLVPPRIDATTPLGISVANGAFTYQKQDLEIGQGTIGLKLIRSYTSGAFGSDPELPANWDFNFDIHFTEEELQNQFTFAANSLRPYPPDEWPFVYHVIVGSRSVPFLGGSGPQNNPCPNQIQVNGQLVCPTGAFVGDYNVARPGGETLVFNGDEQTGHHTFTDKDGTIIYFGSRTDPDSTDPQSAPLKAIYELKPNGIRYDFYYSSGALTEVKSNTGYALLFNLDASGYVATACAVNLAKYYVTPQSTCPSGTPTVTYTYGASATYTGGSLLTSATDVFGGVEQYTYGQYDHMTCLKLAGESSCHITNSYNICTLPTNMTYDPGRMHLRDVVYSQTDGTGIHFGYSLVAPSSGTFYCPFNTEGTPNLPAGGTVTNADGGVTNYHFTNYEDSLPASVTDALGNVTSYTYKLSGTIFGFTDIPATITKPSGLKAAYTYDARGNLTSEVETDPNSNSTTATTVYPSSCSNPATCNEATSYTDRNGNEADWTYESFGPVATEMDPAPAANEARPLKLYTYVQRTAYTLNSSGALVSTGEPIWMPSTVTQCQTLAGSNPTPSCDTSAPERVTSYEYGANGTGEELLVKGMVVTADGQSRRTCYSYDDLGRKISETQPRAGLTSCP